MQQSVNSVAVPEFDPVLLPQWLQRRAARFGAKIAIIDANQRCSYAELDRVSSSVALWLQSQGLRRGDRVLIFMENCSEVVISIYGALKAGGVFVVLSAALKPAKLRYILANAEARALISSIDQAPVVEAALAGTKMTPALLWTGPSGHIPPALCGQSTSWQALPTASSLSSEPTMIDQDLASLIYTSGSTGQSKGVMSTHQNMISAARSIIEYLQLRSDDIIANTLPLAFDYGLYQVLMSVMLGATVILEQNFAYLHEMLNRLQHEKATVLPVVPTIVAMLLKLSDLQRYDLSALRCLTNTGAALPVAHIRQLRQLLPQAQLFSMFGLTECKRICYLPPAQLEQRPGSVGQAMPNCEVAIVDEHGLPVAPEIVGELTVRGANVMQGYWRDPELTAAKFRPDPQGAGRVLYTGDYFRQDSDGYLYFVGRKDEMIKSRGERISPKEVENHLCELSGIAEAVVLGVPDPVLGQAVMAVVSLTAGSTLSSGEIRQFCAQVMESCLVPKYVKIVTELPRTGNGKIDKFALQKENNSCSATNC